MGGDGEEEALRQLFEQLNSPYPADRFTEQVMQRLSRRARTRRLVLGAATSVGLVLSGAALSFGVAVVWQALPAAPAWRGLLVADAGQIAFALASLLLIAPIAARGLAK